MVVECRVIPMGARETQIPVSSSIRTFLPPAEPTIAAHPGLAEAVVDLGGEHLSTALGYGSFFNGESSKNGNSPESLVDILIIVHDIAAFHRDNRKRRPQDYNRFTGSPRLQTWVNQFSPNFYPSSLIVDGAPIGIKYGVVGLEDFVAQASAGMRGSEGLGHLYLAGRLQKAMLVPLVEDKDPDIKRQIDLAINQARIDGVWLTLGLLQDRFDYDEFARAYVDLSYAADKRVEKDDKAGLLISQSKDEYGQMLGSLLTSFVENGLLEESEEGGFRKRFSLPEREVRDWLKESKKYAFKINMIKNWFVTYGFARGLSYELAKIRRVWAAKSAEKPPPLGIADFKFSKEFFRESYKDLQQLYVTDYFFANNLPPFVRRFIDRKMPFLLTDIYRQNKRILEELESKSPEGEGD